MITCNLESFLFRSEYTKPIAPKFRLPAARDVTCPRRHICNAEKFCRDPTKITHIVIYFVLIDMVNVSSIVINVILVNWEKRICDKLVPRETYHQLNKLT